MESISNKKLPPIFKLSLLSKILPYFGHLHDWKRILESINKKTNDIWDQNKEVLKYCGRDLKLSLFLEDKFIKFSENILLKDELFEFRTERFFDFNKGTKKTLGKIKELEIDSLILQLCSQLNEDNAIVFQKCDYKIDEIFLQTRTEIAEMIPSPKCTSSILEIKVFEDSQDQDLCKYITESIKIKRVIVKKNENNTFEIETNTKYLEKKVRESLVTYYSCQVSNCICKPKTLCFWNKYSNEISEEQIDKIFEEQIDEICGIYLLENTHRLEVDRYVTKISEIRYLSKIKQQFSKLKILFNFSSCRDGIECDLNYQININSRLITLITKGEEMIFQISGDDKLLVESILDLEFNEKENIAIINCGGILLENVVLQTNRQSEIKDQTLIDKLKEKTRFEDNETESEYKEEIEEINKLPKQCSIKIKISNIHDFISSDALNLIDQDFNQIIVESEEFKIKLIKSNSRSGERIFTVYESLLYKVKTANIRELREMISKKYEK